MSRSKKDLDHIMNFSASPEGQATTTFHEKKPVPQVTYSQGMPFTPSKLKAFLEFKLTPDVRASSKEEILAMLVK